MTKRYILKLSCPDKPGIVASVSGYFFERGANIASSAQYEDPDTSRFFMRMTLDSRDENLSKGFDAIAKKFDMDWSLRAEDAHPRVLILVSKAGHCLADLLYRKSVGDLPADIVAIAGNHTRDQLEIRDLLDVPFHHINAKDEAALHKLVADTRADVIVLARYMQILSDNFCAKYPGKIINIHHSFLPGFKGAKPYHQAHARGVKLIGATAHYVTADLDEGPIIEQDVERITHADTPEAMVAKGRDIERRVLTRALTHHVEDRVMLAGAKTIIL